MPVVGQPTDLFRGRGLVADEVLVGRSEVRDRVQVVQTSEYGGQDVEERPTQKTRWALACGPHAGMPIAKAGC
jgi:hypothetical protein